MNTKISRKITVMFLISIIFVAGCSTIIVNAEKIPTNITVEKMETPVEKSKVIISENYTPTTTMTPTPTPTPTHTIFDSNKVETPKPIENIVLPTLKIGENGEIQAFFGDFYRELPLSNSVSQKIIPDTIIIHTDGQSGNYPEKWNTMTTYWGLGDTKSVHFAVSQDGISQMLPMGDGWVKMANGTTEQWDQNGSWLDYDARSIQIEMGGRNYNYLITGQASPEMVKVIEDTTDKTINLVISLMDFYDITINSIVGHYQIGAGKPDPGNLYFEQYFIPLLEKRIKESEPNKIFGKERLQIYELMKFYGYIENYQLSNDYWENMNERIIKQGKAERILSLEFHGDKYNMFNGVYAMNPESFKRQVKYLMENDYHFLTIHEVRGFVEGWLELPKKSVILTTDPGPLAWESTERIISAFSDLESDYGYKPHMNTFIVPQGLSEEENYLCKENLCWSAYIHAVESGYFSLGTHTYWHNHHNQVSESFAKQDIKISQDIIAENTGITVYAISWPYEICSPYHRMLRDDLGITLGFGGLTHPQNNYVYKDDTQPLCLPRLFPENPDGFSGRPMGKNLEEMLYETERE